MLPLRSLRAKFLLVAIAGVLLPLALVGLWLARATEHSGETLLRERLRSAVTGIVEESGARWVRVRGELLNIAEDPVVRASLQSAGGMRRGPGSLSSTVHAAELPRFTLSGELRPEISLSTPDGVTRWTISGVGDSVARLEPSGKDTTVAEPGRVTVVLPVYAGPTGPAIGALHGFLAPATLLPPAFTGTGVIGAVLGMTDAKSGASLAPLPFDPALLAGNEFNLGGERWLVERRALQEPPIVLLAAAPLTTYTAPFDAAARRGAIALLLVAVSTLVVATLATSRLTRSLERLARAADAVSRGDLGRQVDVPGEDEVGRVAAAFNAMTESLRRTLSELARRESLVAVGEFAASLAHEVRNPLTSIRINLQRVEEKLATQSPLRPPLDRALREIARLERTVTGALRVARSGKVTPQSVDLRDSIERAIHAAEPAFIQAGAKLEPLSHDVGELSLSGDPAALEQVFLNLLLNAAQALEPGGRVEIVATRRSDHIEVAVSDNGIGIAPGSADRVFEPFFSTKAEGTGLGLAIARQIVVAHGGHMTAEQNHGGGTTMRVRLPLRSG